jgi:serine/threonine protein phosphatase PrpC
MVLACDGLWDVVSHKRSVEIVEKIRRKGKGPVDACETVSTFFILNSDSELLSS